MEPHVPSPAHPLYRFAKAIAGGLSEYWHRATCDGLSCLPKGPALLVGNHGLFGFETPIFFYLLHQATGRVPVGLTDRTLFGNRLMRPVLSQLGGVVGTRENALTLLRAGHLVVCYPGGSREVFKSPERKYQLQWERAEGFARIAIDAQVPIVPFAALGVDDSYVNFGHVRALQRRLGRYAFPLAMGLGPIPLPVPFRFLLGAPIPPPSSHEQASQLKEAVTSRVERMLQVVRPLREVRDVEAPHIPVRLVR
jgi:1-acyl-sn-glycerol-3-phosphate acyltransferase